MQSEPERNAWCLVKAVISGFLGKHRAHNFKNLVQNMLAAFDAIGVHMSLKIHFLHHHLEDFNRQL